MRYAFCGVIEGSVTRRPGESETDALRRAELAIQNALDKTCRRFAREGETGGPVVGLESAS